MVARHGDIAAAAAAAARAQRARYLHIRAAGLASLVIGYVVYDRVAALRENNNLAVLLHRGVGLQAARYGNQAVDDLASGSSGKRDAAAIGLDGSRIGYELRLHVVTDSDFHQMVAVQVERGGVAGCQLHAS